MPHKSNQSHNLTKEEWNAKCNLAEDQSIVIKIADKGSNKVVLDRDPQRYLTEGCKQLIDQKADININNFTGKVLSGLTGKSDKMIRKLFNEKLIPEKELKYCSYDFKNTNSLSKMYFLKIYKRYVMFYDVW